jgi:hypothetical protein
MSRLARLKQLVSRDAVCATQISPAVSLSRRAVEAVTAVADQHSAERRFSLASFSHVLADSSGGMSEELRRHSANSMVCVLVIGVVLIFGLLAFLYLLVDRLVPK